MCPLARQGDFYVPEMKELERKSRAAAEAEDTQTDITGSTSGTWAPLFFRVSPAFPKWCPGVLAVLSRR